MRESLFYEVGAGSAEYAELLALRFEELRKPLGMVWTEAEMLADEGDRHFGLRDEGNWLGTVVVSDLGEGVVKLRQIAVTGARQGEGLGRVLMGEVEAALGREGAGEFQLNARMTVAGFYEALGYERVGGEFVEIGMPHVKMKKVFKGG